MLVHASENYYGAEGATDMVGPQAYLATETDRLWVSVYDGFSRMSVPLFMIVSAFLLAPMKEGQSSWDFYRKRALRILPPFPHKISLSCPSELPFSDTVTASAVSVISFLPESTPSAEIISLFSGSK